MMYTVNRPFRPEMMMNRMMRDMCMPPRPYHGPQRPMGFPVDVKKADAAYILTAELPGVKLEEVEITVENDVLSISVTRKLSEDKAEYILRERRWHAPEMVKRSFNLEGIDQSGITASAADGILTITLPKAAPAEGKALRRIAIAGSSVPAIEAPAE